MKKEESIKLKEKSLGYLKDNFYIRSRDENNMLCKKCGEIGHLCC